MSILTTILKNTDMLSGAAKLAFQNPQALGTAAKLLSGRDSSIGGSGGIGGLMEAFSSNGMGDILSSWIGSGENLPISADQIGAILGSDVIGQFAQSAGVDSAEAGDTLASLLPNLIDQLTPDGAVPDANNLEESLSALFS